MSIEEKACIECNELWPNDAEFFQSGRSSTDLLCVCLACYRERYSSGSRRSTKAQAAHIAASSSALLQGLFNSLVAASRQQKIKGA